ncbi:metal ABC transporter ATP-binding protein [Candidatus Mycalebacterium sp.]
MENPLEVKGLTVAYSGLIALWNISLTVPRGSLTAVVGPNGAGKSTLIKAVQNLVPKAAGEVRIFGGLYEESRKSVAYVPQRGNVDWNFPASVFDVVQMGTYSSLGWMRRPGERERRKTFAALKRTAMEEFADRQIGELSGGQQQRVFIARSLVQDADLYFLDEPFQGVDSITEVTIANIMREMSRAGKTMIVVHHNLQTVPDYFDRVVLINREIVACGEVSEVFNRENIGATYGAGG